MINRLETIYKSFAPMHFSPKQGWMNDPNGLAYYKGKYHFFYQSNPYSFKWDAMHWGYATSSDGYHWQHQPIVMYPNPIYKEKEYIGGQFSGSALEVDGKLMIAFTHHHEKLGEPCVETQYITELLDDGSLKEPQLIVDTYPKGYKSDNRDPKLFKYNGDIYFVTGGLSQNNEGVVHLYKQTAQGWEYINCIFTDDGNTQKPIECPDIYQLGDKWVLSLSYMDDYINPYTQTSNAVIAYIGEFTGREFIVKSRQILDYGPDCYAPQTFIDAAGERSFVPWAANPKESMDSAEYPSVNGRFRKLFLKDNRVFMRPWPLPTNEIQQNDALINQKSILPFVSYHFGVLNELSVQIGEDFTIHYQNGQMHIHQGMPHRVNIVKSEFDVVVNHIEITFDGHMCEIIINQGEIWATYRSHIPYTNLSLNLQSDAQDISVYERV